MYAHTKSRMEALCLGFYVPEVPCERVFVCWHMTTCAWLYWVHRARERLKAARELFDEGLIDESDFKKAKADIVSTLSQVFV